MEISFNDIFPPNVKLVLARFLNGLLEDHLTTFIHIIITTNALQNYEKAGVGILSQSPGCSFSIRLPDYNRFHAGTVGANFGSSLRHRFSKVSILCTFGKFVPNQLRGVRLVWVPSHVGIFYNDVTRKSASTIFVPCPVDSFPLRNRRF